MRPTVLVVSSVHPPDDPRIRHKLAATLTSVAEVRLAVREPGPADPAGVIYEPLTGRRAARTLRASWKLLRGGYDVASVHDPELLPAAILAAVLRRRVVFDVHEDIPSQIQTKPYLPGAVREVAAWTVAILLRIMELVGEVTLAEPNYAHLFRRRHPVFANYLADVPPPAPVSDRAGAVYLGDITEARGIGTAIQAIGMSDSRPHLTLIGRCEPEVRTYLDHLAADAGVDVRYVGFLPPHEALPLVAQHAVALSPLHDLPNYQNSLPTKLLEYLSLGLPVVASALPGAQRVLGDSPGIVWVEPGDVLALSSGIDLALRSPDVTRAALAGAGDVRTTYRWPAVAVRSYYLGSG